MNLTTQDIAKLGEIATLLEVSGYPKAGNVHRTQDFNDMTFEDFLISSTCIRGPLERVSINGYKCYPYMLNQVEIGECILDSVRSTHNLIGTNTNLGISMLLIPIAATFGALSDTNPINNLQKTLDTIIKNTEVDDAIALTKAINIANAGGMDNKTNQYDVNNQETLDEIRNNHINIYDLLEMSQSYDRISYELVNGLPVISTYGYPTYAKYVDKYPDNDVTLAVYLEILAHVPDTLIERKYGIEVAEEVSQRALNILNKTEIATDERRMQLKDFDYFLQKKHYNPGTSADFTAASLFVGLVDKYSINGI